MTRVTNLASQNLSLALLQQTQSRVMDAQVQISTGKKAERYMGVAPDAARLVSVKADHARVTPFVAGNEIVDLRLQRMESRSEEHRSDLQPPLRIGYAGFRQQRKKPKPS